VSTLQPDSPSEREARLAKHAEAKRQREYASNGAMQEARAAAIDINTAKQFTKEELAMHDGYFEYFDHKYTEKKSPLLYANLMPVYASLHAAANDTRLCFFLFRYTSILMISFFLSLVPLFFLLLLLLIPTNTHRSDPDLPIWLGLGGHVIDVSQSAYLYGPGKPRSCYAGKDVTRISALQVRRFLLLGGGGGGRGCARERFDCLMEGLCAHFLCSAWSLISRGG